MGILKIRAIKGMIAWTLALLFLPGLSSTRASAMTEPSLLEVTGILEEIGHDKEGESLTLNVNGELVSGPLSPGCTFLDEKEQSLKKKVFLDRYRKRYVTVEIIEETKEIINCIAQ
jgi:hypothetical protein